MDGNGGDLRKDIEMTASGDTTLGEKGTGEYLSSSIVHNSNTTHLM